mgnify:CR=1 FL=1
MTKKFRALALLLSAVILCSLAGCSLTQTDTSDIVSEWTELVTRPGQSGTSDASGDTGTTVANGSKVNTTKNNGKNNSKSSGANIDATHTTRKPGSPTLDFTPVADKGANYNVKGTVTIAVNTSRPTDYDAMFDTMAKLYPNVTIKFDYWTDNGNGTQEYLSTRAATGKMADIVFDDAGCLPSYVMQGWVYPITKFVNADPEASNLPDNLRKDYTYCNELYALPNSAHFDVTIFNVDLLNKLGLKQPKMQWTMDEYENYLRKAAAKFSSKLCVGTSDLGNAYTTYAWYLSMQKGQRYGTFGYNYDTQQVDADILIEGSKKARYWRTMASGVDAWYESTQKGANGVSQLETNLGLSDYTAAFTSGKALLYDWNTGGTNKTSLNYKFKYVVVPAPNTNGRLSMHVDCSFMTTACKAENAEAAYQLLRFMTISTNGNLARLTMYEDSQKGKYSLNSRIYYPTSNSKAVINKFNSLSVATETDKYLVANIPNSGRYDVNKLVPNLYDSFFKYAASAYNDVRDGKDDGSGMKEAISKWNQAIKANIEQMNTEIKKAQADFNKSH